MAAAFFFSSCDQPTANESTPSPTPLPEIIPADGVTLTASPNPVPAGDGAGTTTVKWNGGAKGAAAIYVSIDGGEEKLFAEGVEGASEAPWIQQGMTYEFRLYASPERKELLARVSVTRAK